MTHPTDEAHYRDRIKLAAAFDALCPDATRQPVIPHHQHYASAFEWFCKGAEYGRAHPLIHSAPPVVDTFAEGN